MDHNGNVYSMAVDLIVIGTLYIQTIQYIILLYTFRTVLYDLNTIPAVREISFLRFLCYSYIVTYYIIRHVAL